MKYVLSAILFFLCINYSYAGDVYFCSEDQSIGYAPSEAYKEKSFIEKRFKAYIDFGSEEFESEKIWFRNEDKVECIFDKYSQSLYCISDFGSAISINKESLRFHLSSIYNSGSNQTDDISLSYGSCEKF